MERNSIFPIHSLYGVGHSLQCSVNPENRLTNFFPLFAQKEILSDLITTFIEL